VGVCDYQKASLFERIECRSGFDHFIYRCKVEFLG
jgi:hypothetical protein